MTDRFSPTPDGRWVQLSASDKGRNAASPQILTSMLNQLVFT